LPRPLALNTVSDKNSWEPHVMAYVFETIPADRGRIDLNDPREVNWWRKRFDCSEDQLRRAVAKVGNSAAKVEQLLDGSENAITL
jgi:hypothetical protein